MLCGIREFIMGVVPTVALIAFLLAGLTFPVFSGGGMLLWVYLKAQKMRAKYEKYLILAMLLPGFFLALGVLLIIVAVLAPVFIALLLGMSGGSPC